ncbi:endonuclease/exonuclease/phosphatase family protein [Spongiibacter nanhainus]|uniref:Endonuclease/exonuclease/phosphatase family protein n=1 Tax=Spongiibacter nanhainus TaxID=2794344 RepID=A0A7T4R3Z2_9GAMM|nr:endonuclease/exonuclease/phosphatase family protein [Spongiibacter nanhainus]QQD19907.1 endonuclease/exonuclease/phosphatase family protein [Spongiibacter nanhainus]
MQRLRVLSYNVHKGFCAANRRFLLEEIRDTIRLVDADLVFLQEVVGENTRHAAELSDWIDESQFEYLADRSWPHYAYGRNAVYPHGHHGNAILSKHHILSSDNIDISHYARSQRGLLHTVIEPGIHLICTHMGLLGWERNRQFQQLVEVVEERLPPEAPLIIAGDFNDWRGKLHGLFQHRLGLKEAITQIDGKPARSFPSQRPLLRLDRIYYRGFNAVTAAALKGAPWNALSDHCALFAELAPQDWQGRQIVGGKVQA